MKKNVILVLLVLSFSVGLFGQENEVILESSDSQLTDEIIQQAFSQLGLTMYPFSCDLKSGDEITFSVEQYKNGRKKDSRSFGKIETKENISSEFTLFIRKDNNQISFTKMHRTNESLSSQGCSFSIKKYNVSMSYPYKPILKPGKKTMVHLLMMNKKSIKSPNRNTPIEEIVVEYDMVFIVYITLNKEKNYESSN